MSTAGRRKPPPTTPDAPTGDPGPVAPASSAVGQPSMTIEMRSPASILPYDRNPRLNDGAVDAVARSIQEFGFRQPIVVDDAGVIIVGHTRWKAATKLGLASVPVHVAVGMSEQDARAYRLADNKTADLAAWDTELLTVEISELAAMQVDISTLPGFTSIELEALLSSATTPPIIADFENKDTMLNTIHVHFRNDEDRMEFGKRLGVVVTVKTNNIWYPPLRPDEISHRESELEQ